MATKKQIEKLADEAQAAAERLQEAMQEFWDDKSGRWQESDVGTDWQAKMDEVENAAAALDPSFFDD